MKSQIAHMIAIAFFVALTIGIVASKASAAIILSENFESGTIGAVPGSPWTVTDNGGTATTRTRDDTIATTLFGPVGNKYAEFIDTSSGGSGATTRIQNLALTPTSNDFIAISFDFYEVSGVGSTNADTFNVQFGQDAASATGGRSIDFRISEGRLYNATTAVNPPPLTTVATNVYTLGVKNHMDIVANYSAASPTYNYGTAAPNTFDVWINGVLVGDDVPFRNNQSTAIDSIRLATEGTGIQRFAIDNFQIANGADALLVPEPSAYLMAGFGLCCLTLFRSRMK